MFGFRNDGKKLKKIDPILRMTSYIMPKRYDAMVNYKGLVRCEKIDKFIKEKLETENIRFSYMDVVLAGIVRMYANRPKLNRFVMNGNLFARKGIFISFCVKKQLTDDGAETTVKLEFDGTESIYDVKKKIDEAVFENKKQEEKNNTDKFVGLLLKIPNFILNFVMGCIRFGDRHGMIPKKILNLSPFHSSCFVTNMKSISCDYVYHHLYDFGTTGLFVAMGKEHLEPVVDPLTDEIVVGKVMKLGVVIDERLCDGLYNSRSIKTGLRFIQDPYLLCDRLLEDEVKKDPDL